MVNVDKRGLDPTQFVSPAGSSCSSHNWRCSQCGGIRELGHGQRWAASSRCGGSRYIPPYSTSRIVAFEVIGPGISRYSYRCGRTVHAKGALILCTNNRDRLGRSSSIKHTKSTTRNTMHIALGETVVTGRIGIGAAIETIVECPATCRS